MTVVQKCVCSTSFQDGSPSYDMHCVDPLREHTVASSSRNFLHHDERTKRASVLQPTDEGLPHFPANMEPYNASNSTPQGVHGTLKRASTQKEPVCDTEHKTEQPEALSVRKLFSMADKQDKVRSIKGRCMLHWQRVLLVCANATNINLRKTVVWSPLFSETVFDGDWSVGGTGTCLCFSIPVHLVSVLMFLALDASVQ